ncbi:MAG: hypothetical protein N3A58_00810 [Spirochaetes bacterium]|nr:hypothetical protein [Spirochaetota bacterium]
MKNNVLLIGILLILCGVVILIDQFFNLRINLWPFILIIGGIFLSTKATKESPGILIPSTYIFLLGIFFLVETYFNWQFASKTWPTYILIAGLSFFTAYLYSKNINYLYPAGAIIFISLIFYSKTINNNIIMGFGLIIIGIIFAVSSIFNKKE